MLIKLKFHTVNAVCLSNPTSGDEKTIIHQDIYTPKCLLQHCLQQPGYISNLNLHPQIDMENTMKYYLAIK